MSFHRHLDVFVAKSFAQPCPRCGLYIGSPHAITTKKETPKQLSLCFEAGDKIVNSTCILDVYVTERRNETKSPTKAHCRALYRLALNTSARKFAAFQRHFFQLSNGPVRAKKLLTSED